MRLTRAPVVSIALIRGRATGNGSEIALASDMTFVSREKAVLSQWEVGIGLVAGGGPMARLPRLMGRGRALEVLLSSDDIGGELAEAYGYVNRALPDAELDAFVDALARRIASWSSRSPRSERCSLRKRATLSRYQALSSTGTLCAPHSSQKTTTSWIWSPAFI